MRYDRAELNRILAIRRGNHEGQGPEPYIDLVVRVTPELLKALLGGVWETEDGKRSRLEAVSIDSDGLAYPEMVTEVPA